MKSLRTYIGMANFLGALLLGVGLAQATDIKGVISSTLTILEDSQLVGDVTCETVDQACIAFGASGIQLNLNGFTITGPAEPPSNCVTTAEFLPADGIRVVNQSQVTILGPGLVQKFRRHGIFGQASTEVTVRGLVSSHNCFSGYLLAGVSGSLVEGSVFVRNSIASAELPCGGNCINNSNNNVIRRNVFGGNGFVGPPNNDFGVGLVGTSSGNLIEENTMAGNTNGVLVQPGAADNIVRRNIIVGNPPVQVSATFGDFGGVDIQDLAPAGANTFEDNLCVTYSGASAAPCPNLAPPPRSGK